MQDLRITRRGKRLAGCPIKFPYELPCFPPVQSGFDKYRILIVIEILKLVLDPVNHTIRYFSFRRVPHLLHPSTRAAQVCFNPVAAARAGAVIGAAANPAALHTFVYLSLYPGQNGLATGFFFLVEVVHASVRINAVFYISLIQCVKKLNSAVIFSFDSLNQLVDRVAPGAIIRDVVLGEPGF